ncbi:MAG: lamin tail domain-containing protein [Bacteroidales bacterium]|nr:lamin tail domain-containing protein [Bacteroidales bacterium]
MKKVVWIFLAFSVTVSGQYHFDFESGVLLVWNQVPAGRWKITSREPLSGSASLQHFYDSDQSGVDFAGLELNYPDPSQLMRFSFLVRHGYDPSSSNNWQFYMSLTDTAGIDQISGLSAYAIGVNLDCSDDLVKIWQINNGIVSTVCTSELNYQEAIGTSGVAHFVVSRNPNGEWSIEYRNGQNNGSFIEIARGNEEVFISGKYAGIRFGYSSSQDRKLWLDDLTITGTFYRDTIPPAVAGIEITGLNCLKISFDETIGYWNRYCFLWDHQPPDSVCVSGKIFRLYFKNDFPNRVNQQLKISGIRDTDGNVIRDTILGFCQELCEFGDVIISEIMPDPEPSVYLPSCEYLELFNRHVKPVQVNGWTLKINERELELGESLIPGSGYLLITSKNEACNITDVLCLSSLPSQSALPNKGAKIRLYDQYNRLVHLAEYASTDRYGHSKSEGGWSLECIDPDRLCAGSDGWKFSYAWRGGTPGSFNSIDERSADNEPPQVLYNGIADSNYIEMTFNEPVFIDEHTSTVFMMGQDTLTFVSSHHPFVQNTVQLKVEKELDPGRSYEVFIRNLNDCEKNVNAAINTVLEAPSKPAGSIPVINEIMYDPAENGQEYFEIHNPGEQWFDIRDLTYVIADPGQFNTRVTYLSEHSHLLKPGGYVVFCRNRNSLIEEWLLDPGTDIVESDHWSTLPDYGSCIRLYDRSGKFIDGVCFHDSLHQELIESSSGIALERIRSGPCTQPGNCWTSAAASAGFGTPGKVNSQHISPGFESEEILHLDPPVISPDNDGFEDIMMIRVGIGEGDKLYDLFITDMDGYVIKYLVGRGNPGSDDWFIWKGEDGESNMVLPGIYIIHARIMSTAGTYTARKPCAVIYR